MNSLYTRLVSGLLFPIHERLKRHSTVAVNKQMEVSQWWSSEQIQHYQNKRLQDFLYRISKTVPYYKNLFSTQGIDPKTIDSPEKLAQLPFLTKALIREHTEDLKAENANDLTRFNTGGSSGEPLVFYIGKERVSHDVAAKWRATRWWDVDIGDKEIVLWGSPIELGGQDYVKQVRDKLLRTTLLPAFEMSMDKLNQFVRSIRKIKPAMLFGYPSALALIAEHAKTIRVDLAGLGIKVAFVTSERLYDHQKAVIEEGFGCQVANGYGGRDAGFIAHACPAGGMHITAEDIIVEIIGDDNQPVPSGQPGEVVITHLATSGFPFVRYCTGDVAVLDNQLCSCGRGLPLLKEIQGRATDFIVAADGTIMHGLALIYVVRDLAEVAQFKIVQESLHKTRLLVVPGAGYGEDTASIIVAGFKQRLGDQVTIKIELVSEIPLEQSGKRRYVVSRVDLARRST